MRAVAVLLLLGIALSGPARADRLVEDQPTATSLEPYSAIGYRRGRKLKIKVVQIGWAEVEVKTAKAFLAMQAAAEQDGVTLYIRSGFRSHENQQWLYQAWREGWGNKAARPGFSNHQSGRALDLYLDASIFDWLERNARRFGFKRTVTGEPWHWEFTKVPAKKKARRR
jgi:LAS superfamily LD-carboxypeptidase LdcB